MPDPSTLWHVLAIVGGSILLLFMIVFSPEIVSNIVSVPFEILARLLQLLETLISGARDAMSKFVKNELNFGAADAPPTPAPAVVAAQPVNPPSPYATPYPPYPLQDDLAPYYSQPVSPPVAPPAPAATTATAPASDGTSPLYIIVIRLVYLALGAIIIVSDFVFTALRLGAILFPGLTLPTGLSNLGTFSGALLVAMAILGGFLVADFLNAIPPKARLFPILDEQNRKRFLIAALIAFGLNLIVVGLLFALGQILISLNASFPVLSIILAAILGILQLLIVGLSFPGILQGLTTIFALLAGVLMLVFALVLAVISAVQMLMRLITDQAIPEFFDAFSNVLRLIFRIGIPKAPYPHLNDPNALSVIGLGETSSGLAAQTCASIAQLFSRSSIVAAATYTTEAAKHSNAQNLLRRWQIRNVTPSKQSRSANIKTADAEKIFLTDMKNNLVRAYLQRAIDHENILVMVDLEMIDRGGHDLLVELKDSIPGAQITVVCVLPEQGRYNAQRGRDLSACQKLADLTRPPTSAITADEVVPTITTVILVDMQPKTPLKQVVGDDKIYIPLIASSLATMAMAPQHGSHNKPFIKAVEELNQNDFAFATLAIASIGIPSDRPATKVGPLTRSGNVYANQAINRAKKMTANILQQLLGITPTSVPISQPQGMYSALVQGAPATQPNTQQGLTTTTFAARPDTSERETAHVYFILPIWVGNKHFDNFRIEMGRWMQQFDIVKSMSVVQGEGFDLSSVQQEQRGDRYCQGVVLYGIQSPLQPQLRNPQMGSPATFSSSWD
jgi:hypothetical protein